MAGRLVVTTLNNDTGVLATQNGMTGIAKAWVQFAGATGTIAGSFNVSSVTRTTTGQYTVNFTTSMPNTNYSALITAGTNSGGFGTQYAPNTYNTSSFIAWTYDRTGNSFVDPTTVNIAILSA